MHVIHTLCCCPTLWEDACAVASGLQLASCPAPARRLWIPQADDPRRPKPPSSTAPSSASTSLTLARPVHAAPAYDPHSQDCTLSFLSPTHDFIPRVSQARLVSLLSQARPERHPLSRLSTLVPHTIYASLKHVRTILLIHIKHKQTNLVTTSTLQFARPAPAETPRPRGTFGHELDNVQNTFPLTSAGPDAVSASSSSSAPTSTAPAPVPTTLTAALQQEQQQQQPHSQPSQRPTKRLRSPTPEVSSKRPRAANPAELDDSSMRVEHNQDKRLRSPINGASHNGSSIHANGVSGKMGNGWDHGHLSEQNGAPAVRSLQHDTSYHGHDREEVTRILMQSLNELGYRDTAEQLSHESGYEPETPDVSAFRAAVHGGDWDLAETLLFGSERHDHGMGRDGGAGLTNGVSNPTHSVMSWQKSRQSNGSYGGSLKGLPLVADADVLALKFLLRQQKYLELLESRDLPSAMSVLRDELTPLKRDTGRIHLLSSLLMCRSAEELKKQAAWDGAQGGSRGAVLTALSKYISPSAMIPEHRLATLLSTIQQGQIYDCRFHNTIIPPSLYTDHECSVDDFPLHTLTELRGHTDEVWYLEFSHDGTMLATAGKDGVVCVYETTRWTLRHAFREHGHEQEQERDRERNGNNHTSNGTNNTGSNSSNNGTECGVCFVAFSPNDQYLISCSKSKEFVVLNVQDGRRIAMANHFDYPVTSAAWLPDSQTFVVGTQGSQRPLGLYSLRSSSSSGGVVRNNEIHSFRDPPWESHSSPTSFRITACAVSSDGTRMAATTLNKRLLLYDLSARRQLNDWEVDESLTSVAFAPDDPQILLVSMNQGCVLALSAVTGETLMRYTGACQRQFVLRSCYGGAANQLVVSGSEDSTIHIWRRDSGVSVAVLSAHTPGTVNAISWHPKDPSCFASAGDDRKVRIWTSASAMRTSSLLTSASVAAVLEGPQSNDIKTSG